MQIAITLNHQTSVIHAHLADTVSADGETATITCVGTDQKYRIVLTLDPVETVRMRRKLMTVRCKRCGHTWTLRNPEPPEVCQQCKSRNWRLTNPRLAPPSKLGEEGKKNLDNI